MLQRTISVASEESEMDEPIPSKLNDLSLYESKKEEDVNVNLFSVLKENTPEWPQISVGCVASLIMGAAMPVFAILFGDIIQVKL